MKTWGWHAVLACLLCGLAMAASAEIYECKDLHGNVSLQQQPCQGAGVQQRRVDIDDGKTPAKQPAAQEAASPASAWPTGMPVSRDALMTYIGRLASVAGMPNTPQLALMRFGKLRESQPWLLSVCLALWLMSAWNSLVLLVVAFRQSIWWGLGYLLVPLVPLIFIVVHWRVASKPFLWMLGCSLLGTAIYFMAPLG